MWPSFISLTPLRFYTLFISNYQINVFYFLYYKCHEAKIKSVFASPSTVLGKRKALGYLASKSFK